MVNYSVPENLIVSMLQQPSWWEISLSCPTRLNRGEILEDCMAELFEIGVEGVVENADSPPTLKCYFFGDDVEKMILSITEKEFLVTTYQEVEVQEWLSAARAQFPKVTCENISIIPVMSKEEVVPSMFNPGTFPLIPGTGFGSGHHPSTWLALKLMQSKLLAPSTVIDFGCGSGVLSIAASHFYKCPILALDNDHHALVNAKDNIVLNSLEDFVSLGTSLNSACSSTDLIIANVYREVLLQNRDRFRALLKNGFLIISGIQHDDFFEVHKNYVHGGFFEREIQEKEGWYAALYATFQ